MRAYENLLIFETGAFVLGVRVELALICRSARKQALYIYGPHRNRGRDHWLETSSSPRLVHWGPGWNFGNFPDARKFFVPASQETM